MSFVRSGLSSIAFALVAALVPLGATADVRGSLVAQATQPAAAADASVSGIVSDAGGNPLAGVSVTAKGPVSVSTSTDAGGTFTLSLPPGIYTLVASRAGFNDASQSNYAVLAGAAGTANVTLTPITFSSLRTIGRVSVSSSRSAFNTSPAAITTISAQTFQNQGQLQVQRVLDQTPGIVIDHPGTSANNASPGAITFPSIRGGLGFETASLIDGHPLAVQTFGDYVTTFLNPDVLQSVEVIKGPGAGAPSINFAINGTVNFRTLDPTATLTAQVKQGSDTYGGDSSNFRISDTIANKLGFVLDYAIDGTPGPLQNSRGNVTLSNGWLLDGRSQVGFTTNPATGASATIQNAPQIATASLLGCCINVNQTYTNKTELAKLRYNFSNATVATVSFLGSQTYTDQNGNHVYDYSPQFTPGAGYAGAFTAGNNVPTYQNVFFPNDFEINNEPIFQGELRSTIGKDTVLGRYYTASINRLQYEIVPSGATEDVERLRLNGTVDLCPAGYVAATTGDCAPAAGAGANVPAVPTVYNNRTATVTIPNASYISTEEDVLHGGTLEYDHYLGDGGSVITASLDGTSGVSDSYSITGTQLPSISIYAGSKVRYTTELLRGIFNVGPQLNVTLSNYFTQDYQRFASYGAAAGGPIFSEATNSHYDPRLGLVFRPMPSVSLRASAGSAIAPPYLALLGTSNPTPAISRDGTYATNTVNNGNLRPETAFGYDVGGDFRIGRDGATIVSTDAYLNNVFNQFITSSTFANGTATVCTGGAAKVPPCAGGASAVTLPLLTSGSQNLTNARYEGLELAVRRAPRAGFGYVAQGALMRAYPYNVGPCVYRNTPAGGAACTGTPTTNLGIVPYANFYGSGSGGVGNFNSVNNHSIPYSQGYAEVSYATRNGGYASFGEQYYGPNNSLYVPAFFVANATLRYPFKYGLSLQASADNLFNIYANTTISQAAGVAVPLVNGKFGVTNANVIGPRVLRFFLTENFGR